MSNAPATPALKSWVASANAADCHFPIQNLPYGVFKPTPDADARVGAAIGDQILDLSVLEQAGLLRTPAPLFAAASLNAFMASGRDTWRSVRAQLGTLLQADTATLRDDAALRARALVPQASATMLLPVQIPGYTDFYSSKEHATNVGSLFRDPKNALLPNWTEIPIGYNGRASSIVVGGTPVRRPNGQVKLPNQERPVFSPCLKLDFELETGFFVGVPNGMAEPVACGEAESHIFGMVLLNDWSARDIQAWEYVPLGPFNAKGFATTISPWVVTMDALEPFRTAQPAQDPLPLPYLRHDGAHAFDIHLEVALRPQGAPQAATIARTNFKHMYWTMAQQLAHHTVSGCNTRVGDLMGSGTISGPDHGSYGSLLELTSNGKTPVDIGGATRAFIEDGDEVVMTGWCQGDGYRVGFGHCAGTVLPALPIAG
ncbi:Fumarylacetoacetate (FAA) hydrolase family protein [Pigmentiphaga humi]|uniref:fumarylacetoacetase n=1 Tax=Pigmentiphaga humi TaxID=2478468 RepID=A0A3P4B2W4_9BURK|nr:fumarylacetoacetase [Pigmentiphaga humi]VCU70402.1 Fumarylacetoacetate (FAA) hydrolase family protein [Pigmentiphaga humi]